MTYALKQEIFTDNLIQFPGLQVLPGGKQEAPKNTSKKNNSNCNSRGIPKAKAADPIRRIEDIHAMQQYFLDKGQYRNYALFTLGINWALRVGDLIDLRIDDLFDTGAMIEADIGKKEFETVIVRDSLLIHEEKTNKRQEIVLTRQNKEILEKLYWQLKKTGGWEPIFQSREGGPLTISMVNKILKGAAKAVGVKDHVSSHSMRKTFVYQTIKAHEGDQNALMLLQQMLNHSDIRITFRYCGIENEQKTQLRNEISSLLEI